MTRSREGVALKLAFLHNHSNTMVRLLLAAWQKTSHRTTPQSQDRQGIAKLLEAENKAKDIIEAAKKGEAESLGGGFFFPPPPLNSRLT